MNAEQAFLGAIETPPVVTTYISRGSSTQSHPSTPSHWPKGSNGGADGSGGRALDAHSSFVSLMQLETIHKVVSELTLHEGIGKWANGLRTNTVSNIGKLMLSVLAFAFILFFTKFEL